VSHHDAESITRSLSVTDEDNILAITPWEAESFSRLKCSVTIRVFDMISAVLKSEPHCLPDSVLNIQFWQLIEACVLQPGSLGFDICATEILDALPNSLTELLRILQEKLPSKMAELSSVLRTRTDLFRNLRDSLISDSVTHEQEQLLQGLEILHRCQMLGQIVKVRSVLLWLKYSAFINLVFFFCFVIELCQTSDYLN
jgi:hypothetical protein